MKCKSGQHTYMNPDSAAMCCNGYHRELRSVYQDNSDAELNGRVRVNGESLIHVWIKDVEQKD